MLFIFIVSLLGFSFAFRISEGLVQRHLFSRSEMTKIGTAYLCSVWMLFFILPRSRFNLWVALFVPIVVTAIVLLALMTRRLRLFRARFREALTLIVLKMKSGKSYRRAFAEVTEESPSSLRSMLSEISNVVAFSQQNNNVKADPFIEEVVEELLKADASPHFALRRLTSFREKLRMEDEFRRRSGQVMARIRAQSLVMTGLYLAVLIFVAVKFGWRAHQEVIVVSIALFVSGALWIWLGGRRMKWKV